MEDHLGTRAALAMAKWRERGRVVGLETSKGVL